MALDMQVNDSVGIAFLVSAGIVYEIIAGACSSPQTTEINADKRSPTLMKWVNLGVAQSAFFILAAAVFDRKHSVPILLGGGLAIAIMYGSYLHAKQSGTRSAAAGVPGTESY